MSDGIDAAISDLQQQIAERMRAVNGLLKLKGLEPAYAETEITASVASGKIRSDQWYTKGLSTAAREFLEMRERAGLGAASVDEIYSALVQGGFKFETKDEAYAKPALRQSLTKNTAIFHRLPNGNVGLAEWYSLGRNGDAGADPEPRQRRVSPSKPRVVERKRDRPKVVQSRGATPSGTRITSITLMQAVKNAVATMKGGFTKQQVLDWINQHHPDLNADARRDSVFTLVTRLKDELNLTVVREGTGKEPFVYAVEGKAKGESEAQKKAPSRTGP